jgi:hypothetical protein
MSTALKFNDTVNERMEEHADSLAEQLHHLEGEVAELRHTVSDLADIVVGDIKERRETAIALSARTSEVPIPALLVPGGQTTLNAVQALRRPWLLLEVLGELRTAIKMYLDARYRARTSTNILVPTIFVLFGLNYLLFNYTPLDLPVFRQIAERLVEIVLAVLLYKVISQEVVRYRLMLGQTAIVSRTRSAIPASLIHNDPDMAAVHRQESL